MATIYKRGRQWWLAYTIDRERVQKAIGPYKAIAELAKKDIEVQMAKQRAGLALVDRKLSEYIPQFLSHVRLHTKPSTAKRYVQVIGHLSDFLEALEDPPSKLSRISPPIIEQYKFHRIELVKPQTVNYELTCLHRFFRYACEMNYIKENPIQSIKKISNPKRKAPRFLAKEEITKLLRYCGTKHYLEETVKLLLNTGMRWGELRALEWNDIDWNEKVLHIRIKEDWSPKGGERKVPMNKTVEEILRMLLKEKKNRWILTTSTGSQIRHSRTWERFRQACQKAGIENVTLHSLRHTFASHLVMAGVDLASVSKLLGHKDISTTMIYSHLSQDHLRGAVEKLEF